MTKAQYWAQRPNPMLLRQMALAKKRKAALDLRAAKIRAKLGRFSRTVINSRVTDAAPTNRHASSSPDTEKSPATATLQGMVSPGYPPAGSRSSSCPDSHSDCSANAAPVNGENTHKASRTLETELTVLFGEKSRQAI